MSNVVELYTTYNVLDTSPRDTSSYANYDGTLFELNTRENFKPSEFNSLYMFSNEGGIFIPGLTEKLNPCA